MSVIYESQQPHILLNVIRSSSRSLQRVSVVHKSQHSHILLNVIPSPSRSIQYVSVVYEESQYYHILLNVIPSPSRSLQTVSVVWVPTLSHFIERISLPFSISTESECRLWVLPLSHILLIVIRSSLFLQRVSVTYESSHYSYHQCLSLLLFFSLSVYSSTFHLIDLL